MKVKSPCIKVCKLQDNICIGCFRNIEEIKKWKRLTNKEKIVILNKLEKRALDFFGFNDELERQVKIILEQE